MKRSVCNDATVERLNATARLPNSARRGESLTYVRVLDEAWPDRTRCAWRLDGQLYKPGAEVSLHALPSPLVAIEAAGRSKIGHGHERSEHLYILWHWNGGWREVCRASSASWDWTWILGPPARKLLTSGTLEERASIQIENLLEAVEKAIGNVDPELRPMVCAGIEERLAAGQVAA